MARNVVAPLFRISAMIGRDVRRMAVCVGLEGRCAGFTGPLRYSDCQASDRGPSAALSAAFVRCEIRARSFFRQGREQMDHERVNVRAEFGDDERNPMHHQLRR